MSPVDPEDVATGVARFVVWSFKEYMKQGVMDVLFVAAVGGVLGAGALGGPWYLVAGTTGLGYVATAGAVLGAVLVILILEGSRFIEPLFHAMSGAQGAALREMIIGAALILVMRLRPEGLLAERPPKTAPPA